MSELSCITRKRGIWSLWRRDAPSRRPRRAAPAAMERECPFDCQRTSFFDSLKKQAGPKTCLFFVCGMYFFPGCKRAVPWGRRLVGHPPGLRA